MPDGRAPSTRERPFGVREIVRIAGQSLDALGLVWIEAEVAQATKHASGHLYFSLRDAQTVLPAVMWARDLARTRCAIEGGKRIRVRGRLGVYDRDGKMQLYADFAEPAGAGAEAAALAALKAKLAAEGMFDPAKKRALPRFPKRIGIVTSARGAAVHDIIRTVQRRLPTPILIADAAVQGPNAPAQLVSAMAMVVRAGVDVLIVGRGGGSATDLTAFNHERVVRTISRCPVPVISAVGHEVDLSLADLAADARASTPTAAAELVVPDGIALGEILRKEARRLEREMQHRLARARQDLDRATLTMQARNERAIAGARQQLHQLEQRLAQSHPHARVLGHRTALGALATRLAAAQLGPKLARAHRDLASLVGRRDAAIARTLDRDRAELGRIGAQLAALSPLAVLDRGYAMVQRDGAILRDASAAAPGDRLVVKLARGSLAVVVEGEES